MQTPGAVSAEAVREELLRVLARGEFQRQKNLLEEVLEWLLPRLESEEIAVVGAVLRWVLLFALALAVMLLVQRWMRALRVRRAELEVEPRAVPVDLEARLVELLARAQEARERGDLRLALRHLFLALFLALGGRGDLDYRDAWTNRELLRRGKPSRATRALLEPLVRELEAKEFGRAAVSAADVDRLEALLSEERGRGARGVA